MSRKTHVLSIPAAVLLTTVLSASADAIVPPDIDIRPESGSFGWVVLLLLLLLGIIVCVIIFLRERKNKNKKNSE